MVNRNIEDGQYVVLYSEGGAETVYATAYGEEQIDATLAACKGTHPNTSPRYGKATRIAAVRREPWTQVDGEDA